MSLRVLIPILLIVFSLLVTLIGYVAIRTDLTKDIEQQTLRYMNIELSKLQSLVEPLLAKNDSRGIKSLQSLKASEFDNKAMLIVNEKGIIVASNNQQEISAPWQASKIELDKHLVEKTVNTTRSFSRFSKDRKLLDGYISLCVRDLSKGLRSYSCGFLYYQLDVDFRQHQARSWLVKQSVYIAAGSGLAALVLMLILHLKVTGRVLKIKSTLDLWSKGDRNASIELKGNDELNHIANLINNLVKQFSNDEQALIFNQQVNDAIIQSANYSIIATDTHGIITTFNSSAEKLLGYDKYELINKQTPAIFHDKEEVILHNEKLCQELNLDIDPSFETFVAKARRGQLDENNWTYISKNGSRIPVRLSVTALYDTHGHIYGFLGIAYDITRQLEAEEQLEKLAYYDALTQLPNRMLYNDRLNQTIAFAQREQSHFSVFFLDLDKFKFVNDTYGHEVGDKLLKKVTEILTQCVRKSDTVARLGGDEFTVILPGMDNHYDKLAVGLIAEKIISKLSEDIIIDNHLIQIGASIGISIYPQHGMEASTLNKHADIAMYQAKEKGRGQYLFYQDSSMATSD